MESEISLVMAYYNRPDLLYFTLRTLQLSSQRNVTEVIVVDDGSLPDQKASLVCNGFDLNIKIIDISPTTKTWFNSCIPFNRGFREAKGNIIIIQSPECFHFGDVILHALQNVREDNYVLYSCKWIPEGITKEFHNLKNASEIEEKFKETFFLSLLERRDRWYHHPIHNPTMYHFTAAINRKTLLDGLGGFDERYGEGYCFDDNEFLERVKRSPLTIEMVQSKICCTIHQFHPKFSINNLDARWKRNYNLFHNVTKREKSWKANEVLL